LNRILTIFAIIIFASSCEKIERIDDFPLRPPKMVVNCYFSENEMWVFQVSKSLSVLDNASLQVLDGATLNLYDESGFIESVISNHPYQSIIWDTLPQFNHLYTIEVTSPDFDDTLKATNYLPQFIPINNIELVILDSSFFSSEYFSWAYIEGELSVKITDPIETGNYYQFSLFKYDSIMFAGEFGYLRKKEIFINSNDVPIENSSDDNIGGKDYLLFSDNLFNGESYEFTLNFKTDEVIKINYYYVELLSLTKDGYLYRKTVDNYNNSEYDMYAEPVQVYSNVENGFGIFAGVTSHIDSVLFVH